MKEFTDYPVQGDMVDGYKYDDPLSFDPKYGHLASGVIPADCIESCSASGDVDEAVTHWVAKLNLASILEPHRELVEDYLKEYGAWDDLATADMETLAKRILWTACCDLSEDDGSWNGISR